MKAKYLKYNIKTAKRNILLSFLILICVFYTLIFISGCKKFIDVDPPTTSVNVGNVYATDPTAIAVLTAIYTNMSAEDNGSLISVGPGLICMSLYSGLSADELTLDQGISDATLMAYYKNSLDNRITASTDFWNNIYPLLYKVNAAIKGLDKTTTLTSSIKNQLLGEAYFLRAFAYFYLSNQYGDVPLILSTDYTTTSIKERTAKSEVYQQVIQDLIQAQSLMEDKYFDATLLRTTSERVRPNKSAATALLARTYLYINDWTNAEIQATRIIENSGIYEAVPLSDVFLKNSKETIWALQTTDVGVNSNTGEGRLFNMPDGPSANYPDFHPVYLNSRLVNSFESTDLRSTEWIKNTSVAGIDYSYVNKYKIGAEDVPAEEYPIVLRLAEQYLIRAEARAQQNKLTGINSAKSDIDKIRTRAGLTVTNASSQSELLTVIMNERRHELFTEWGHRWLDLKRTNTVNTVMQTETTLKGGTWDNRWALYPIPFASVQTNPNIKQNPGYE